MDTKRIVRACGTCKYADRAGNASPCRNCSSDGSEWVSQWAEKTLEDAHDEPRIEVKSNGEMVNSEPSPLDKQVGGGHYKDFAIQPIEFIVANKLGFREGNAVKYICRHDKKNGKQDIEKAIHYLEMILAEYDQ